MLDDTNRRRSGGRPAPPTDSRMDRLDWYETDLSGAIHERVLFQDLDMSDSTGTRVQFIDCTFRGAQLDRCALEASSFENWAPSSTCARQW